MNRRTTNGNARGASELRVRPTAATAATAAPDLGRLRAAIDALSGVDPELVAPDELTDVLGGLQRAHNALGAVKARWLTVSVRRGVNGGQRPAGWVSEQLGVDGRAAARELAAGEALGELPVVAAAAGRGEISPEHVTAIQRAAGNVEDPGVAASLVDELVGYARDHTPAQTAQQGRRRGMRDAGDQGLADAKAQLAKQRLSFTSAPDGMVDVAGRLTPEVADLTETTLAAFAAPDPQSLPEGERRSYPRRLADALGELARVALASRDLPASRGLPTQALLIVDLDWITGRAGAAPATTTSGEPLSAETARRALCDTDLSRVVMRGPSQVLDIGRKTPVWPDPIRRAVYARDRGRCRRCGRPGQTVHHIVHWCRSGHTSVGNGLTLCFVCHTAVHEGGWTITRHPDNTVVFTGPRGQVLERPPP